MREFRTSGSVRGAASNGRPYRERSGASSVNGLTGSTQPDCHILCSGGTGAHSCHSSFKLGDPRKFWGRSPATP